MAIYTPDTSTPARATRTRIQPDPDFNARFKRRDARSSFTLMNGQIQNLTMAPNRYKIMQGANILANIGVIEQPQTNFRTNAIARQFLFGVNCILSSEGADFSLLNVGAGSDEDPAFGAGTNDEPAIMGAAFGQFRPVAGAAFAPVQNHPIRMNDKFPNECDPIYNIDEDRPHNVERQAQKYAGRMGPDLIKTSSLMCQLNIGQGRNKLVKYFRNNLVARDRTMF